MGMVTVVTLSNMDHDSYLDTEGGTSGFNGKAVCGPNV